MCSILEFWHYRMVQIGHRVVQGPFRCSKKQLAFQRICDLARSGTVWVKIVPWFKHGELFSEVVLWPRPVIILAPQEPETALDDNHFPS